MASSTSAGQNSYIATLWNYVLIFAPESLNECLLTPHAASRLSGSQAILEVGCVNVSLKSRDVHWRGRRTRRNCSLQIINSWSARRSPAVWAVYGADGRGQQPRLFHYSVLVIF